MPSYKLIPTPHDDLDTDNVDAEAVTVLRERAEA